MKRFVLPSMIALLGLSLMGFGFQEKTDPEINFEKEIVPIIKTNCLSCHNKDYNKKGIIFPDKMTEAEALKDAKLWRRSGRAAKSKKMPPNNGTMTDKERDTLVKWVELKFPKKAQ